MNFQLVSFGRSCVHGPSLLRSMGFQHCTQCSHLMAGPDVVQGRIYTGAAIAISEHGGGKWEVQVLLQGLSPVVKQLSEMSSQLFSLSSYCVDNKSKILPVGCQGTKPHRGFFSLLPPSSIISWDFYTLIGFYFLFFFFYYCEYHFMR